LDWATATYSHSLLPASVFLAPPGRSISPQAHKDAQHIPEQQRHAREQRQGRRDMLAGLVAVDQVAGVVEDRARGEHDHLHFHEPRAGGPSIASPGPR